MPTAKLSQIYALMLSIVFMCFLSVFLKLYDLLTSIDNTAVLKNGCVADWQARIKKLHADVVCVQTPLPSRILDTAHWGSQHDSLLLNALKNLFRLSRVLLTLNCQIESDVCRFL